MRKHNDGYALGWVIIMMMILFFLVVSTMALASGYHARSVLNNNKKQVYFTARSVAQAIAADFVNGGTGAGEVRDAVTALLEGENLDPESEERIYLDGPIDIDNADPSMGICTLTGYYVPKTRILTMTINSEKNGQTDNVSVKLKNEIPGKIKGRFDGIKMGSWDAHNLVGAVAGGGSDIWITGTEGTDIAAEDDKNGYGNSTPTTIYSNGPITQSVAIDAGGSSVLGSILCDSDIELTDVDNSFDIESTDPEYSLYAYDKSGGHFSLVSLEGAIEIDKKSRDVHKMVADSISLKGPNMVIYNQIEGKMDITIDSGVSVLGDLYTEGVMDVNMDQAQGLIQIGEKNNAQKINAGELNIGNDTLIYGDINVKSNSEEAASIQGNVTLGGTEYVWIIGNIICDGVVTLSGNVTITGDIFARGINIEYDRDSLAQPVVDGRIFVSDFVNLNGVPDTGGGQTVSMPLVKDVYLYGPEPKLTQTGIITMDNLWTNLPEEEILLQKDKYHDWNDPNNSPETIRNLKAAEAEIAKAKEVEIRQLTVASQLPEEEAVLDTSDVRAGDKAEKFTNGNYEIEKEVYWLTNDAEEEEEGGGGEEESEFHVVSPGSMDSYLVISGDLNLNSFTGLSGQIGKGNSYIVLVDSGTLKLQEEGAATNLDGYVYGKGKLILGEDVVFRGICNIDRLETAAGASVRYVPLNPVRENDLSAIWTLIQFTDEERSENN